MKKILLFPLFFVLLVPAFGQHRKSIYVEGLGNGLILSANFDMRFKPEQNNGLGFRAGIGGGSVSDSDGRFGLVTFPMSINHLVGSKRSFFESGIGVTPMYANVKVPTENSEFVSGDGFGAAAFINIGYRFQPLSNGVMFRINWTPAITASGFSPTWVGLSLGYSFR